MMVGERSEVRNVTDCWRNKIAAYDSALYPTLSPRTFVFTSDVIEHLATLRGSVWAVRARVSSQVDLHVGLVAMLKFAQFTFVHRMTRPFMVCDVFIKAPL